MKIYIVSLLAGVLAGAVYALIGVRSPAPPVVALAGLLGMLLGEQGLTVAKRAIQGHSITGEWFAAECVPKITGTPPAADPTQPVLVVPASASTSANGGIKK
jgi:XapX domain-containing protein